MVDVLFLFKLCWSGFSLLGVGVGLYLVDRGRKLRAKSGRIADTDTSRITELTPGTAEIKGTAHPAEETNVMESPITASDALASQVRVEKYKSSNEGGGSWKTIHEEESAIPIRVDDGTGEVRVELPPDGELNAELIRTTVGRGEEPPDRLRRFVEQEADVDDATRYDLGLLSVGERRRYSEGVIEPGEEVYVLGTAREMAGWDGQVVVDEPTQSGDFVLSNKSEETLIKEGKWGGGILLAAGGLAAAMGTLFAVGPWLVL